jgi:hypothetical protein
MKIFTESRDKKMMDKELIIKKIDNLYTEIAALRREILIEFAIQYKDKSCPLGRLPICGMWSDHEDIKDSVEWVNRLRADVQKREKELGLV